MQQSLIKVLCLVQNPTLSRKNKKSLFCFISFFHFFFPLRQQLYFLIKIDQIIHEEEEDRMSTTNNTGQESEDHNINKNKCTATRSTTTNFNSTAEDYIFLPPAQARKTLRVTAATLRLWDKSGKLYTERMPSGYRFYRIPLRMLDSETRKEYEDHQQQRYERSQRQAETTTAATIPRACTRTTQHIIDTNKLKYIYARVSTPKQKKSGDLDRQIEALQNQYPNHKVVTDIASGINWKRPALKTLLDLSNKNMVEEIVVIFLY